MKNCILAALISIGFGFFNRAHAGSEFNYQIHWNCKPISNGEINQPLSWYELKKVNLLRYSFITNSLENSTIEIDWVFFDKNHNEIEKMITPFESDPQYFLDELRLINPKLKNEKGIWTYFSAIFFQPLTIDAPESAGPISSGAYQAKASLILMSTSREQSSHPNKSHVSNIDLNCEIQTLLLEGS